MEIRIQKFLSEKGILSRRKTEAYIKKGWISVNGKIVRELGTKIHPEKDVVQLSPEAQSEKDNFQYIAFHKPKGIVTNLPKPGEKDIQSILPESLAHLSAVGRLDKDSEGLILLTNDGIFAKACLQSPVPHERCYKIWIIGTLTSEQKNKLEEGLPLFGDRTLPLTVTMLNPNHFEMVLKEGKNRQIRRMIQKIGHKVVRLKRTHFSHVSIGGLRKGEWRALTRQEVQLFLENH